MCFVVSFDRQLSFQYFVPAFLSHTHTHTHNTHSAAAGDGNLVGESYTDVLAQALQPIFASLGILFEANNHAMRNMPSGEEYALCVQSIFGHDVDVATWDFATTDKGGNNNNSNDDWKLMAYAYRLAHISQSPHNTAAKRKHAPLPPSSPHHRKAMHHSRPALVSLHQTTSQTQLLKQMEDLGMTILAWDEQHESGALDEFPDMLGHERPEEIPRLARFMQCAHRYERGTPGCTEHKYNTSVCASRSGMTTTTATTTTSNSQSNPGFKYHALTGNILSFVLLDLLEDAVTSLQERTPVDKLESPDEMHNRLAQELKEIHVKEQEHYNNIFSTDFHWTPSSSDMDASPDNPLMNDLGALLKTPALCHTALLPADIRMKGLLTENTTAVTSRVTDIAGYEQAVLFSTIRDTEHHRPGPDNPNKTVYVDSRVDRATQLTLVGSDQERSNCPLAQHLDYRDSFFVSSVEGWRSLTIPNDMELEHYSEYDARKNKGWIVVCVTQCVDGPLCPYNDLYYRVGSQAVAANPRNISQTMMDKIGHLELQVNGIAVTDVSEMAGCYSLHHADGHVWTANQDGKYDISVRIANASSWSYIRFSSFILL